MQKQVSSKQIMKVDKVNIKGLLSPVVFKFKATYSSEGQDLQVDLSYSEEFKSVLSSHYQPTKIEHKTKHVEFTADYLFIRVQSTLKQVSFSFTPSFPKQDVKDHIERELARNRQLHPDWDEKQLELKYMKNPGMRV